jgi:hypothetical protein
MTLNDWIIYVMVFLGAVTLVQWIFQGIQWLRRVRRHQQVTEEWRRAHLDPDRPPDSPFR